MDELLRKSALDYHRLPTPGKIAVVPTKGLLNQRDLALAYSPGVAAACEEIVNDPATARLYTARGNLIGVITNGTAVLGLGPIGPLASKPVMEGKGVLFKKFAGIDVFDIEINERDPDKLVDIIASLEPTFGGINLEDIKAPECFYIERKLRERLKIPVFHDDQHGTAIIVGAAVLNGLKVVGKDIGKVKLVCSGAGAAALACLDLLVSLGLSMENIWVSDIKGVVYTGRKEEMDDNKIRYAKETKARTLADIMPGADVFLGLSAARVLKPDMIKPHGAEAADPGAGQPRAGDPARPGQGGAQRRDHRHRPLRLSRTRSTTCCAFRSFSAGALDVGATTINEPMKLAAVRAIAELAQAEQSDIVAIAYGEQDLSFGPEYLIPKPFDPRLIVKIAPGSGAGRDGKRRGNAADPGFRRVSRAALAVRLPLRPDHEAGVHDGQEESDARRLLRRRGRTRAARGAGRRGRRRGQADPDRPSRGAQSPHREVRIAHPARAGISNA